MPYFNAAYLRSCYKNDGITEQEVENAIRVIIQRTGGSLYEENRHTMNLLLDDFSLKREDATRQNLYIQIFKVVNQYDIVGNQHRIPDAIIFLNGLPVVVFEFKSAIKQYTTIEDAYKQLTIQT